MSIDLTDLNNWPNGAEACVESWFVKWIDGAEYYFIEGAARWSISSRPWSIEKYKSKGCKITMRPQEPDKWKEGEERMNAVQQNGNNGEHYEELENYSKQPRYTDSSGMDWIDEFAANNSIEEFRAAMRFTIGKYERRLGKKDDRSKELYKIADYYKRWSDVERAIELGK